MPLNYASLLKISVAGAILLSVGACKPANKGQGALKSQGIEALNLSKSEASVFAKYFETEPCEVDEMEAFGALAGMGLGESGQKDMTFGSREFNGGVVTYTDMRVEAEGDTAFSAKSAVFHCPSMGDEAPSFARLDLTDATVRDAGMNFNFGTLNIAKPTPDAAAAIIDGMFGNTAGNQGDVGFRAVSVTDVTLVSDDVNGSLTALSWGEIRDETGEGKADLTVDNLDATFPGQNGAQDMTVTFGGMSARDMNVGGDMNARQAMSPDSMVGSVVGSLNAFKKPYDELIIETMAIDSEGFKIDFGGLEGKTTEEGGVITTRQTLKPTEVNFKPALAQTPTFAGYYQIIESLGFETVKLSGSAVTVLDNEDDSVTVSDGLFVVDDGFVLNFEYAAEGLSDMVAKLEAQAESGEPADPMAAYDTLKLRNLRMTLEDNSIVERGLKLASQMLGQSEDTIKTMLSFGAIAASTQAENEVQAEVYTETVGAFAEFVKKGGTLTIEANPPEPFLLAPLVTDKGGDIDPDTLGFSASQASGSE